MIWNYVLILAILRLHTLGDAKVLHVDVIEDIHVFDDVHIEFDDHFLFDQIL